MSMLPQAWLVTERAWALPLTVLLPLTVAVLLPLLRRHPNAREALTLAGGLLLAAIALSLWPLAASGLRFEFWTWMPGLQFAFELEPLGLIFACVAGCLWPVTSLYAIGYMRSNQEDDQTRFYVCFAIALAAAMGIAMAANGLTLFVCYEALTLATWPLVAHKNTAAARRGARIYLLTLLLTSIGLFLPALIWTYALTGTTDFRLGGIFPETVSPAILGVLFAMYLFGVGKAALMPFHRWLPAAMVAPTPVSALLHAVAVVKAGVFSVLKITLYTFGLERLQFSGAGEAMSAVAAFTMITASLVALSKDSLKARLAYSTISQLSYIVLAATLATGAAALGGALHIATHAVAKITLFFCAGAIYTATHKTEISQLDGLGRRMPLTFAAFLLASLSIIGIPPLAGFWSKWMLLQGTAEAGALLLLAALLFSSVLNVAYLIPIPIRAFLRPPPDEPEPADTLSGESAQRASGFAEAPWACVLPLLATALACVLLFFYADRVIAPLMHVLESS